MKTKKTITESGLILSEFMNTRSINWRTNLLSPTIEYIQENAAFKKGIDYILFDNPKLQANKYKSDMYLNPRSNALYYYIRFHKSFTDNRFDLEKLKKAIKPVI